jgi:MFS family permease
MTYASSPVPDSPTVENVFLKMLPITMAVFVGFLTMGLALPVLPLHLHYTLDMSPVVVGIAIGLQFAAALLSRASAGALVDTRGSKRAMIMGLLVASSSGLVYWASLAFIGTPTVSVGVLM